MDKFWICVVCLSIKQQAVLSIGGFLVPTKMVQQREHRFYVATGKRGGFCDNMRAVDV